MLLKLKKSTMSIYTEWYNQKKFAIQALIFFYILFLNIAFKLVNKKHM